MKTAVKTLATSILAVIGVALVFTIAGSGKTWAVDQSPVPFSFDENWMVALCEKDKNGVYLPDKEIEECCQDQTRKCTPACDKKYKNSEDRGKCLDRCSRASYLCFQRAGVKNPGVSPVPPGLRFQLRQPKVIAPKSEKDPNASPLSPTIQLKQLPKVIAPTQ